MKSLEEEYKASLEENLENSRKKDLTVISPFMQDEWKGFEQVEAEGMLKKYDTKVSKEVIDAVAQNRNRIAF